MPSHRVSLAVASTLVVAACAAPPPQTVTYGAPVSTESGAFIARLGADTFSVERFTRTHDRLEGDVVLRVPTTRVMHYVVGIGPNGLPTRADFTLRRPDGTPVPNAMRSASIVFGPDSAASTVVRDTAATRMVGARGAFPGVTGSFAMIEQALRHFVASGRDSADLVMLNVGAPAVSVFPTKIMRPDSARITWFGGSPQWVRIDRSGRILALDATPTTFKVVVDRLPSADIPAVANAFAAAEQAGRGLSMSTRDTVRASVGRANLMVDYSRPLRRGRVIFGSVVPFDTVWRTGANAATQLRTDADLTMGGYNIPAGTYTLWTIPSRSGAWKLVINRQTGQWGTVYNPAQDLARIDLRTERVATPVEQFTISIVPEGGGGTLALAWDRTRASVPFTVR